MYSEPQFILIELDDEITDVLGKIKEAKDVCVYIVFPTRSLLLSSVVNLKLLRKKTEQLGKKIAIVTNDKIGRNLASQAGITAFRDKREVTLTLQFTLQEVEEGGEAEPTEKRESTFFKRWKDRFAKTISEDDQQEQYKLMFVKPSKRAFITILLGSIFILGAIIFFALPDAEVRISSKLTTIPVVTNINLTNGPSDVGERQVHMAQIEVSYERVLKEPPTGQNVIGGKANGTVTIFNNSTKSWPIVGNSRLQTRDGLVFLTKKFVNIPAGVGGKAGEVKVEVEARELDTNNQVIGNRGNIPPTKFSFPALSASNQKLITAESFSPFSGGTTSVDFFVTKDDLERANKNILQELKNHAPEELTNALKKKMEVTKTDNLQLFQVFDEKFVQMELVSVNLPRELLNKQVDGIEVTGKMKAKAYYYNTSDAIDILTEHMKTHQLTYKEKLLQVDRDSLQFINIFPFQGTSVKITAKMNGLVTYSFEKNSDELTKKIRDQITGVTADDAKRYIQNLPEVENVSIRLAPFWQKSLPTIKENIHIIVEEPSV